MLTFFVWELQSNKILKKYGYFVNNVSLEPVSNPNSTSVGPSHFTCSQICSKTHLSNFGKACATSSKVYNQLGK